MMNAPQTMEARPAALVCQPRKKRPKKPLGIMFDDVRPVEVRAVRIGEPARAVSMDAPQKVHAFWREVIEKREWYDPEKETMIAFSLSAKLELKAWHLVSIGTRRFSLVEPITVFRPAVLVSAHSVIIAHNHPSGNTGASWQDIEVTTQIHKAGDIMQITLQDHVIIAGDNHTSIRSFLNGDRRSPWPVAPKPAAGESRKVAST